MDDVQGRNQARERQWRTWMIAAQLGDAASYEKLLHSLLEPLRSYARRRMASEQGPEDLVQNVLLSLHRARHTYRPERPVGPWLWSIARNATVDAHRARAVREERERPLGGELLDGMAAGLEAVDGAVMRRDLERAMRQLPDRQREAVRLLHIEGLSAKEAAERAGTTAGAVKVRAHRGYRALRRLLGDASDG
jgi:RNA polymerase sigma-70 factor (ECF subfamily)